MRAWLRRWGWPALKALLGLTILVVIGRQFYRDLQGLDLSELTLRPGWMVACGALYVLALGCSAYFWHRLLLACGQRPPLLQSLKAYYVGLLGKYLPGKAWALFMRGALVKGPESGLGVAIVTAFYEVFTTMASGALVAAVVFALQPFVADDVPVLAVNPALVGAVIFLMLGVPLLPAVFNRLVRRLSRRFQNVEAFRLPPLRIGTLLLGLAIMACAWVFFGLSLWSAVRSLVELPYPLTPPVLARYAAIMGLAYAGGFLIVVVPSGMGVREMIIMTYLVPELGSEGASRDIRIALLAALVLRLVWTAAEVIVAGFLYLVPFASGEQTPRKAAVK
jgi:glycosyltransferase 2 family protein